MGRVSMGTLDGLATLIGFSEACAISAVYGGRELWVSTSFAKNRKLVGLIGEPATRILMREFGGVKGIKVPCLSVFWHMRDVLAVTQAVRGGMALKDIAKDLGVSLRTAKYLLFEGKRIGLICSGKKTRLTRGSHRTAKSRGTLCPTSFRGSTHPRNVGQLELF